ncbi:MAG: PEP-CTERM sorting domain-containing protein [Planctomycetia bacterium]|nr:PEP-CTERM sorting domain-containing protein [Planctomycetia bacterium]
MNPSEIVQFQAALAPATSSQNTFDVVCELAIYDPFLGSRTASDSDVTTVSGTSRFQLDCTFDEDTHAATSVNGIKFLYGDGAGGEGPLEFDDVSFTLDHSTSYDPVVTLDVWSTGLRGSNSTGRQENDQDPNLIPFVPVNGSGQFLLDTSTTPKRSDFLLYLSEGSLSMSGLFECTWSLEDSELWNYFEPMPGSGTVSVGTPSVAGRVATYDVDVSIPINSTFCVWNPGVFAPDPLGYIAATGTMVMSGQFTREVVPEPSTVVLLLGLLVAGLAAWRRR